MSVLPPVIYQLGIGGISGFIIGYAAKKLSKLILILFGVFVAFLLYLSSKGIISVNYEELWKTIYNMLSYLGQTAQWFISFLSFLPFMGSFVVGLTLGFKAG